ncbi:alpha/beta hydrolase [Enterococcus wangshanyuanii]|uniref:Phospholipase/carboxylesterase n=1 Tax=Enterococcus wangshanyuanii TaxID=2005703 RepID=A0ABQ1NKK2_9ENTE|nr:alpha/beta hydrolase [Enterococcus wangshanyuanii]GGC79533.1 phospholipase/carboxylesterase [Enterococcus wangshanyuanii]
MNYIIEPGKTNAPVFITLHGTGGDEHSLLPIGKELNANATLIGIRGTVQESGMNRYFRRLAEGLYDEQDLELRGKELADFIYTLAEKHNFSLDQVVLIGYSNGANIAINLMLRDASFKKAVLLHPMYPIEVATPQHLKDTHTFMSFGQHDPIVSVEESKKVLNLFAENHGSVAHIWTVSHQLTYDEIAAAKKWLEAL